MGMLKEALVEFETAAEIWKSSLGPDHPQMEMVSTSIEECAQGQ
jgi:hypothetical protein